MRPLFVVVSFLFVLVSQISGQTRTTRPSPDYEFHIVASTHSNLVALGSPPTMNESSMVAFVATTSTGSKIFQGSGGPLRSRLMRPEIWAHIDPLVLISPRWDVIFGGRLESGGAGLFISESGQGSIEVIADTLLGFGAFEGLPSMNRAGSVAFYAEVPNRLKVAGLSNPDLDAKIPDPFSRPGKSETSRAPSELGGKGIFVQEQNGKILVAVDTLGVFDDLKPWVSIADDESVAFVGTKRGGTTGIYIQRQGQVLTEIASTRIRFTDFGPPLLNGKGQVAFWGELKTGGQSVFSGNGTGGRLRELASSDDPGLDIIESVISMNDQGSLLLIGEFAGRKSLYLLQDDLPLAPVLRQGDSLLELGVVEDIEITPRCLNELHHMACRVVCRDGDDRFEGILLVRPRD